MRKLTQRHFIAHGERKTWRRKQAGDKHYAQVSVSCFHIHPPLSHRPSAPFSLSEQHEARGIPPECFVCRTCYNSIITALRQTLSRTLLNTGKSCFQRRKTRFGVTFAAFRGVIPYVLNPKTVKVGLQDCLVGLQDCLVWAARLTILKAFLLVSDDQQARQKKEISHVLLNVNNIHEKQRNNK